jgi:hypothetical protein
MTVSALRRPRRSKQAEAAVAGKQVVLAAFVHDHRAYGAPGFLGAPLGSLSVTSA